MYKKEKVKEAKSGEAEKLRSDLLEAQKLFSIQLADVNREDGWGKVTSISLRETAQGIFSILRKNVSISPLLVFKILS